MQVNINFRDEFEEFLQEYGHHVLFQRSGRKIRCRCWDEKYLEAKSKCPLCLGTGYVSRIERHKVRRKSAVQIISRPNMSQLSQVGHMWVDAQTFYMRHDSHPKVGDFIYEVGWTDQQKPSHLVAAYRINDVIGNRGDNGRIEYWTVAAKGETTYLDFQNSIVRSIGPIRNYELIQDKGV